MQRRRTLHVSPVRSGTEAGERPRAKAPTSRPAPKGTPPTGGSNGPLGGRGAAFRVAFGYLPDLPDLRDHSPGSKEFEKSATGAAYTACLGRKSGMLLASKAALPGRIHLGDAGHLPPVEQQGEIGSCTANAVIGLVEYLIRSHAGKPLDLSRMFLYYATRRLLGFTGDTGAYIRSTIQAMRLFGVPPESDWPHDAALLDTEPNAFHFAYASNFRAIRYARLDPYGSRGSDTLARVKKALADGFPAAFGFPVYSSIDSMGPDFVIPLPATSDSVVGGHAVLAVGYDDSIAVSGGSNGALIIRNSWGEEWGDAGYAYLPYDYVSSELAVDFWTIFHNDFVELSNFY